MIFWPLQCPNRNKATITEIDKSDNPITIPRPNEKNFSNFVTDLDGGKVPKFVANIRARIPNKIVCDPTITNPIKNKKAFRSS